MKTRAGSNATKLDSLSKPTSQAHLTACYDAFCSKYTMELAIVAIIALVAIVALVALRPAATPQNAPASAPAATPDHRLAYARRFGRAPDHLNTGRAW